MKFAQNIILKNEDDRQALIDFENKLATLTLGERIYVCQSTNEGSSQLDFAKLFILYLSSEKEIVHEIRRILAWTNQAEKAYFLIDQFTSKNRAVLLTAIELIRMLREAVAVTPLINIFTTEDIELAKAIIDSLGVMNDLIAIKFLSHTLKTDIRDLLLHTMKVLSHRTKDVSWDIFKNLLNHEDKEIRREAAYAIAARKSPRSA
ncbi:unnamed protein product, partial [marine sediment metagenome]